MIAKHLTDSALWERINRYYVEDTENGYAFVEHITKKYGWKRSYTLKVIDEYKKFIYLSCLTKKNTRPPHDVDRVWRTHLTYSKDYRERFCQGCLTRFLDYTTPRTSLLSNANKELYQFTRSFYAREFHAPPPNDVWPEHLFSPATEEPEKISLNATLLLDVKNKLRRSLPFLPHAVFVSLLICNKRHIDGTHLLIWIILSYIVLFIGAKICPSFLKEEDVDLIDKDNNSSINI